MSLEDIAFGASSKPWPGPSYECTRTSGDTVYPYTLTDALRLLAAHGQLRHLLLCVTSDGRYQASLKSPDRESFSVDIRPDPVDCLLNICHAPGRITVAERQPYRVRL